VIAFIGETNLLTLCASMGLGKRVVISERNDPARQCLPFPWGGLRPRLYRHAARVTANSHGALETMAAYVPASKLAFVPNPLPAPPPGTGAAPELPNGPLLLAVGRLHRQKALDVLLEAFTQLPPGLEHWSLVLVGQGEEETSLRSLAEHLGIAQRTHWAGQVDDPYPYYLGAGLFVQPSRHEGMSNALLEAMACGLPAVVSDAADGSLELVEDGVSGLVVPVENAPALAGALTRLARDPALARRLGDAARRRTTPYRMEQALAQWERVITAC
jgi:glycosyltransferase involved in cell wall biosynthesis